MAHKVDVHRELEQAWAELMSAVESVPNEDREKPGITGDWSLKDLLGHIAFWSGYAAEIVRCVCDDRPQDITVGEGDEWWEGWNEREYTLRKDRPFTELRVECLRNYEEANSCLDRAPEEKLNVVLRGEEVAAHLAANTTEHYREHAAQIRDWLRGVETSEE